MTIDKIHLVYFSATYTTRKVAHMFLSGWDKEVKEYDVTAEVLTQDVDLGASDLLVVVMPVYGGVIPVSAAKSLARFKGCSTPAVLMAVYGNRDYDDALLQMKDMVENNGCKAVAAAAFVAQHSIFRMVAEGRPDEKDAEMILKFSAGCHSLCDEVADCMQLPELVVKGNRPYKELKNMPMYPEGDDNCTACGKCAHECPTGAINMATPKLTNTEKCIKCGRCIVVCPSHARDYRGEFYKSVLPKFMALCAGRKEPELIFPE